MTRTESRLTPRTYSKPRPVHIVMRDGKTVHGGIYLNEGQALAPYLASRKSGWVNVIEARWSAEHETHHHVVLQADHFLLALPLEAGTPVHGRAADSAVRDVVISLEDATTVRGELHLSERQRLVDYLHACGRFLPVLNATRGPGNERLGDCAVNCLAIREVRDAQVFAPNSMAIATEPGTNAAPSEQPIADADLLARRSGATRVVPAGPIRDRRTDPTGSRLTREPSGADEDSTPAAARLEAQRDLADWLDGHWLVRIGSRAQLAPPDPAALTTSPTLEEVWTALADRNHMAPAELSVLVASAFGLSVANLDQATEAAIQAIPEELARTLGVVPLTSSALSLVVATSDPSSMDIEQQLRLVTPRRIQFRIAAPSDIRAALDRHYAAFGPD